VKGRREEQPVLLAAGRGFRGDDVTETRELLHGDSSADESRARSIGATSTAAVPRLTTASQHR